MSIAPASTPVVTFQYHAFGLRIAADREVPGLTRALTLGTPDVQVWLGSLPQEFGGHGARAGSSPMSGLQLDDASESWVTVWKHTNFFRFLYEDKTEFFIDLSGTKIWGIWPSDLTLADTATYLLGPIMNVVLRLRGSIALHASAVRIGDVAVALVGPEGAGKSTTAASFSLAGFPVLTDDIATIKDEGDAFRIIPAYPRIRLWPRSVEMLFGSEEALPRLTPGWDKRYLQLDSPAHRFEPEAVPLAAIYFLHPRSLDASTPTIDDEPKRDAMVKLIANIGANYMLEHVASDTSFDLLQRIARFVPLRRLVPRADAAFLPQLRDMVVNDVRMLQAIRVERG